jgi:hypothetical protein
MAFAVRRGNEEGIHMTEQDALHISMHIDSLRSGTEYRSAYLLIRRRRPDVARLDKESDEYAAIRLLIGTWEQIAIFAQNFNEKQRKKWFRCQPVSLMWEFLKDAVEVIRNSTGENYAANFEALHRQYQDWIGTADGKNYRTAEMQAICGRFA